MGIADAESAPMLANGLKERRITVGSEDRLLSIWTVSEVTEVQQKDVGRCGEVFAGASRSGTTWRADMVCIYSTRTLVLP